MNGQELVAECRRRLRDTEPPYLWDNDELLRYLNHAEQQFALRTHCLIDFEPDTFTLAAEASSHAFDPHYVSLVWARVVGSTTPLRRVNSTLRRLNPVPEGLPVLYSVAGTTPLRITLYPAAREEYQVAYVAAHRPFEDITMDTEPAVGVEYHLALTYGAVHECLSHSDTDGFSPEAVDMYEKRWETAVRDAKREVFRRLNSFNTIAVPRTT